MSVGKTHVVSLQMQGLTCDFTVREEKCLLYSTRDSSSYLSRDATVCVCVRVCCYMHACMFMNVYVWVCACQFDISPWAAPTHSHVSQSVSERDPVRQSNLYPNGCDCRLAVFIWVFSDYMPIAHGFAGSSRVCARGGGVWRQSTSIIHRLLSALEAACTPPPPTPPLPCYCCLLI